MKTSPAPNLRQQPPQKIGPSLWLVFRVLGRVHIRWRRPFPLKLKWWVLPVCRRLSCPDCICGWNYISVSVRCLISHSFFSFVPSRGRTNIFHYSYQGYLGCSEFLKSGL